MLSASCTVQGRKGVKSVFQPSPVGPNIISKIHDFIISSSTKLILSTLAPVLYKIWCFVFLIVQEANGRSAQGRN